MKRIRHCPVHPSSFILPTSSFILSYQCILPAIAAEPISALLAYNEEPHVYEVIDNWVARLDNLLPTS